MITARVDGRRIPTPPAATLRELRRGPGLLWIDAVEASDEEITLLEQAFDLHPLVLEDLTHRNQRPKIDEFPDYLFVVLFGALRVAGEIRLAEVHVLIGDAYVVTVSEAALPSLTTLSEQCDKRPELGCGATAVLLYRICDALVDSVFPILDELEEEIDGIETEIVQTPGPDTVRRIFSLKRDLNVLRRVLGPERDLMQSLSGPRTPRLSGESQLYLRDVYDHTVRLVEQVDSYRDLVTSALDVYLSSVSNRLGDQTRRLTVVATIFLPLTFLTGFFGMNFGALVAAIATPAALAIGLSVMASSVPVIYLVGVRRATVAARPVPEPPQRRSSRSLRIRVIHGRGPRAPHA